MKSMKGRIIKKLKSISTFTSVKQNLVFWTNNLSNQYFQSSSPPKEYEKDNIQSELVTASSITVSEITKDDQEKQQAPGQCENDKADFRTPMKSQEDMLSAVSNNEENGNTLQHPSDNVRAIPLSDQLQLSAEPGIQRYRADSLVETEGSALQPLNLKIDQSLSHSTLFPCLKLTDMEESKMIDTNDHSEASASLREFEEKCPPGGSESVVLYTTSMRGIRKTFEDCTTIRFLLESFGIQYFERDVSMHLEYREELWKIMGCRVVPPRLFIRGRYIGGADEVVGLHERGMLRKLLQGIPLAANNCACTGCAGVRFVLCFNCNGSRKIINKEGLGDDEQAVRCSECNENGLVKCPTCSLNK